MAPHPSSVAVQLLSDPAASYWLKDAVTTLQDRDPLDALADAEALLLAQKDRLSLMGIRP